MSWMNWIEAWHAADRAANEAMRAAARQPTPAPDRLDGPPAAAETLEAKRLREVADALFEQATVAMRASTRRPPIPPRIGYDEMWRLVLKADCHSLVGRLALRQQVPA